MLSRAFLKVKHTSLGAKVTHREIAEIAGTYTPREWNETYRGNFATENDALMLDNSNL